MGKGKIKRRRWNEKDYIGWKINKRKNEKWSVDGREENGKGRWVGYRWIIKVKEEKGERKYEKWIKEKDGKKSRREIRKIWRKI